MDSEETNYRSSVAQAKRTAILDAAQTLFLKTGYSATGMTEIAALADVSTATLYKYFRSKDILFSEIIERATKDLDMGLGKMTIDDDLVKAAYKTINRLLKSHLDNGLPQLMRIVIAEAYSSPELARDTFRRITEKWYGPSKKIMDKLVVAGVAKPHDTDLSARFLIGMIKEAFIWPYLFGIEADISREKRRATMREIVSIFLTRYGTESFKADEATREWVKPLPRTRSD
ncbi:MAG: TetR/AcrR family transcriptional regulator [Parvibaculum sp.]